MEHANAAPTPTSPAASGIMTTLISVAAIADYT